MAPDRPKKGGLLYLQRRERSSRWPIMCRWTGRWMRRRPPRARKRPPWARKRPARRVAWMVPWPGLSAVTPRHSAPCTATPSPGYCATCAHWPATTPRTSPQKPGSRPPATSPPSTATTTASAAGSPPSPATAPSTTNAPPPPRPPPIPVPAEDLAGLAAADDTAARALDALATTNAIRLIAHLPPDQAEAVLLRAVIGLDATTAAHVLGKRPGAVRTAAYRGLRTLARRGSGWAPENGRRK
jgi:hypothetical protein